MKKTKHRWQSYLHVKAWCMLCEEFAHRQRMQMQLAAIDGAPLDAVYRDETWTWVRLGDPRVTPEQRARVMHIVEELK